MSGAYRHEAKVRFGDVDHAGIVYYPRFYIYFHETFESMFDEHGPRYADVLDGRRLGFPTAHIETDFVAPLRYGDAMLLDLSIPEMGRSSAKLHYRGVRKSDGKEVVKARITSVCVGMDDLKSRPIPDDIRALFARFSGQ